MFPILHLIPRFWVFAFLNPFQSKASVLFLVPSFFPLCFFLSLSLQHALPPKEDYSLTLLVKIVYLFYPISFIRSGSERRNESAENVERKVQKYSLRGRKTRALKILVLALRTSSVLSLSVLSVLPFPSGLSSFPSYPYFMSCLPRKSFLSYLFCPCLS